MRAVMHARRATSTFWWSNLCCKRGEKKWFVSVTSCGRLGSRQTSSSSAARRSKTGPTFQEPYCTRPPTKDASSKRPRERAERLLRKAAQDEFTIQKLA